MVKWVLILHSVKKGFENRMRGPKPLSLHLTNRQQKMLAQIVRRSTSPQCEVKRAQISLAAHGGLNNQQIADHFGLQPQTVRTGRRRWVQGAERLALLEAEDDEATWRDALHQLLTDDPRSGAPATFTPEQICQIVAVGCEPPADSNRPVSHSTPTELADQVLKRNIVSTISPRSVGRFLKRSGSQAPSVTLLAEPSPEG
jgi:putative transposase